jgi:hypothetical protein
MVAIPNLTQFFGGVPAPPPDGADPGPTMDFSIPSPWQNPDLWDSVVFTLSSDPSVRFELPPLGMGKVEIKVPWKVKLDSKGGAGKAKPRSTKTGGEATKDKIKIVAVDEAWPFILAASMQITPGSGPWNVTHPKLSLGQVFQVEIESWTDAPSEDEHGIITWELGYSQISPGAQTGAGGGNATTTPDSGDNQRGQTVTNFGGIPGNTVTFPGAPNPKKTDPNTPFKPAQDEAAQP